MKTSPLFETHKSLGASFIEAFGVLLPAKFSDPYDEHHSVRHEAAIFDLSFRGMLRFSGEDRTEFLQGMITNDVKSLKLHEGTYAALLTAKGHMISDLRVLVLDDSLLVDLNSDKAELIFQTLNRYIISEDVEISDVSERFGIISIQGPKSAEMLNAISQAPRLEFKALKEHAFMTQRLGLIDTMIVKTAYTGEEGFDLIAPSGQIESLWKLLLEGGGRRAPEGEGRKAKGEVKNFGVKPAGLEVFNALRIEAGIPLFGIDMDEATIPLEAPIEDRAISYAKGCYIGQEIVARLKYRGRPNKFLVGLKFLGDFLPNREAPIFSLGGKKDERQVGKITSAVFSYSLSEKIGFGYVHRGFEQVGTELSVSGENGTCVAKVTEVPFYKKIDEGMRG